VPDYEPFHRYRHFMVPRWSTVSVRLNHLHAYSHLWQVLFPHNSVLSRAELCTEGGGGCHFQKYSVLQNWKLALLDIVKTNCFFFRAVTRRTETVPWLRRLVTGLPPRRLGFEPGPVHVGFVVEKVALGQVFPSSTSVFPCQFHSTAAPLRGKIKNLIIFLFIFITLVTHYDNTYVAWNFGVNPCMYIKMLIAA
jgi:hypothetical protein